jgi:hypothetical protein
MLPGNVRIFQSSCARKFRSRQALRWAVPRVRHTAPSTGEDGQADELGVALVVADDRGAGHAWGGRHAVILRGRPFRSPP